MIITGNGSKGHHTFTLEITETNVDTSNNSSTISYEFKLRASNTSWRWSGYGSSIKYTITINGTQITGTIPSFNGNPTTLKSGTMDIPHDSNGKKTLIFDFSVSDTTGVSYTCGNASANGSLALTDILQKAKILTAPNFTDEDNPVITYQNTIGATATLEACISSDGAGTSPIVAYRSISSTASSYTFNLSSSEREALQNATPNSTTATIYFVIKTTINGISDVDSVSRTLTIVNANPTIQTRTYQDTNSSVTSVTQDDTILVQSLSVPRFNFTNIEAKKGATLSSIDILVNNISWYTHTLSGTTIASYSADTSQPSESSNVNAIIRVTDSRGNIGEYTLPLTIEAYQPPTARTGVNRENNFYSNTRIEAEAIYSPVTNNTYTLKYKYKKHSDNTWSQEYSLTSNVPVQVNLDNIFDWDVKITMADSFMASPSNDFDWYIPRGIPPFFFDRDLQSVGVGCFPRCWNTLEIGDYYGNPKTITEMMYPIGSIYMTSDSTFDPNDSLSEQIRVLPAVTPIPKTCTWVLLDTQTIGGKSVYYWERTA